MSESQGRANYQQDIVQLKEQFETSDQGLSSDTAKERLLIQTNWKSEPSSTRC